MKILRTTKQFGTLTGSNFEYNNENYTRIMDSNMARNDDTGNIQRFDSLSLVTQLNIN
jgi:hypothetical protein